MKAALKKFGAIFLFTLFAASTARADLLCENACNLVIEFTGDSSLEAVEPLVIRFGAGGEINTGSASSAFVNGDSYPMNAGDTLSFSAGGRLDLGQGGNIDYSVMNLKVVGNITISDSSGGNINLLANSGLTLDGNLTIDSGILQNSGTLDLAAGTISGGGSGSVTLVGNGTVIAGSNNAVIVPSTTLVNGVLNPATISFANGGNLSGTTGTLVINTPLQTTTPAVLGSVNLATLSVDDLSLLQGLEMPTTDGSTCTVQNDACLAANGAEYRLENGEFVALGSQQSPAAGAGGGPLGPVMLGAFSLLGLWRRLPAR